MSGLSILPAGHSGTPCANTLRQQVREITRAASSRSDPIRNDLLVWAQNNLCSLRVTSKFSKEQTCCRGTMSLPRNGRCTRSRFREFSSSSSSPLLSLSHKYQWNKPSTCPYITYIQGGRQDRKTGNWRKLQHYMRKAPDPQTMLHWGLQCENRKKTPQHKSTYTINT